jgi:type I restriction enzyme M protein
MAKSIKVKIQKPKQSTAQRLNAVIKSCRDIMRKDRGLSSDAERLPMLTWLMFLKFWEDKETEFETEAELNNLPYTPIIASPYRWSDWSNNEKLSGDDLLFFINNEKQADDTFGLLAYLRSLGDSENERQRIVGSVFKDVMNRMVSGYLLREVVNKINEIHFNSSDEIHTLSQLYEGMLRDMRDAAGSAGEFYTPRAVVRFMIDRIDPQLGETILDPACGTGGFLVEAFEYLRNSEAGKNPNNYDFLHHHTLSGNEVKPLPYLLAQMNLLLHGLEKPKIFYQNALTQKEIKQISDDDRVSIILANPPFGGEEEKFVSEGFPEQTAETALLFLQLFIRKIKRKGVPLSVPFPKGSKESKTQGLLGGRAAIVVPNGTLFAEGAAGRIKRQLLKEFNLHTIVRLPDGVFAPYTDIPANLLFFTQGDQTEKIWFYEMTPPNGRKKYSKTNAIQNEDFDDIRTWWSERTENDAAWCVDFQAILAAKKEETKPILADADKCRSESNRLRKNLRENKDTLLEKEKNALERKIKESENKEKELRTRAEAIELNAYNLDLKNPNRKPDFEYSDPALLLEQILQDEARVFELLQSLHQDFQVKKEVGNE